MARDTWTVEDLQSVANFTSELQDSVQALAAEHGVHVHDLAVNISDEGDKSRIGLITLNNARDTTLQFEAGDYEIGLQ